MRSTLLISLAISVLAVVFALQNGTIIDVDLGPFTFKGSVALILLITFALGVLVGILATVPSQFRSALQTHKLKKTIKQKDKLSVQQESHVPLEEQPELRADMELPLQTASDAPEASPKPLPPADAAKSNI